jgi:hypothetical protein
MVAKGQKNVVWITRTGLLLACLIVVQILPFPAPLKQFITGPLVNMVLLIAVLSTDLLGGIIMAILSPVLAFFIGTHSALGYLLPVVPFIMLGNIAYVYFFHLFNGKKKVTLLQFAGLIVGSVIKFLILFIAVTFIITKLPILLKTAMGVVQLYTALGGGILAILVGKILESNHSWK